MIIKIIFVNNVRNFGDIFFFSYAFNLFLVLIVLIIMNKIKLYVMNVNNFMKLLIIIAIYAEYNIVL